jgi:hypothetical protein
MRFSSWGSGTLLVSRDASVLEFDPVAQLVYARPINGTRAQPYIIPLAACLYLVEHAGEADEMDDRQLSLLNTPAPAAPRPAGSFKDDTEKL